MDSARPVHSSFTYNVLVVALVAVIASGVALLFLATGGPPRVATFEVGQGMSVDCLYSARTPVCYRFKVTNIGGANGFVRCAVEPAGDSKAVFGNKEPEYEVPMAIQPGDTLRLYTQVSPGESKEIAEPTVTCRTV